MNLTIRWIGLACLALAPAADFARAQSAIEVKELRTIKDKQLGFAAMAMSRDGKLLACGGLGGLAKGVRIWNVDTGDELKPVPNQGWVRSLAFSHDGKRLAAANDDGSVRVFSLASGKELARATGGLADRIEHVLFSPSGNSLLIAFAAGGDVAIRLCDSATGKEIRRYKGHTLGVTSLAFAPDGKRFVSGGMDKSLRLWEVAKPKEIRRFDGHEGMVQSVAFSDDGKRLLSGAGDKTLRTWNADNGAELAKMDEPVGSVNAVAFLLGGRFAVSGGGGEFEANAKGIGVELKMNLGKAQAVRLWDVDAGKQLHLFDGPAFAVTRVAVSADGRRVFAGSANGTMHVWEIPDAKTLP